MATDTPDPLCAVQTHGQVLAAKLAAGIPPYPQTCPLLLPCLLWGLSIEPSPLKPEGVGDTKYGLESGKAWRQTGKQTPQNTFYGPDRHFTG